MHQQYMAVGSKFEVGGLLTISGTTPWQAITHMKRSWLQFRWSSKRAEGIPLNNRGRRYSEL